jgi:RimJ/RimL family protein N-acetyltransferase
MINSLLEAQKDGKGFHWVVIHEKIIVGLVSLIDVRRNHRAWTLNRAELAYWVAPAAQSRGYATEAAWAVMNFAFGRLAFLKLIVYHAADNPSSAHVVKKLGFRHVGNEREAFCKHGIWHDLSHYELLESEYYANNHI